VRYAGLASDLDELPLIAHDPERIRRQKRVEFIVRQQFHALRKVLLQHLQTEVLPPLLGGRDIIQSFWNARRSRVCVP